MYNLEIQNFFQRFEISIFFLTKSLVILKAVMLMILTMMVIFLLLTNQEEIKYQTLG